MKSRAPIVFLVLVAINIFAVPEVALADAVDGENAEIEKVSNSEESSIVDANENDGAQTDKTANLSTSRQDSNTLLTTQSSIRNPFRLSSVSTNKKTFRAGSTIVVRMKVKGAKPRSCSVGFDGADSMCSTTDFGYNARTGLYEFRWEVTNSTKVGRYRADTIVLTDSRGNEFRFFSKQLKKGSGRSYVDMSKASFRV